MAAGNQTATQATRVIFAALNFQLPQLFSLQGKPRAMLRPETQAGVEFSRRSWVGGGGSLDPAPWPSRGG